MADTLVFNRIARVQWGEGLGCAVNGPVVQLNGSTVRFIPIGADGKSGVVGVDLYATPGKPKAFDQVKMHGITWTLVDRAGAKSTAPLYETLVSGGGKARL